MPELDSKDEILERLKVHSDSEHKDMIFGLRLVAANYLDISGTSQSRAPQRTDGRYVDVLKRGWEVGRHNPVQINTQLQVKSLSLIEPDLRWSNVKGEHPGITAEVRRAYYRQLYKGNSLNRAYQFKLLDMLTSGRGTFQGGVRDGEIFGEWADALDCTWDSAFREPSRKRFFFRDKHIPLSEAARLFPEVAKLERYMPGSKGGERVVTIVCYWSKTTYAVLYKGKFVSEPVANPYGQIPARSAVLFEELSVRHVTGQVEAQLGPQKLFMRLMRKFREAALRGAPVGVAKGEWSPTHLDEIRSGKEGVILHTKSSNGSFEWVNGPEATSTDIELFNLIQQHLNEASGLNDFQKGRTDTKTDFAAQLYLLAEQSGINGQYATHVHEDGMADDAHMLMEIGERFQRPGISLSVNGHEFQFDDLMPLNPLLGGDGDIDFAPGGVTYKSPMQKLQEAAVLGNVLTMSRQLPPGVDRRFVELSLTSAQVEDADKWLEAYDMARVQEQEAAIAAQEAQAAQQEDFGQPMQAPANTAPQPSGQAA